MIVGPWQSVLYIMGTWPHHIYFLLQRMSFIRWPHMSQLKPFFLTVTDLAKVLFISRPPKMAIYFSSHSSVCSACVYVQHKDVTQLNLREDFPFKKTSPFKKESSCIECLYECIPFSHGRDGPRILSWGGPEISEIFFFKYASI